MPLFRVYLEETSTRLLVKTVEAATPAEAHAFAQASLEDDTWTEWDASSSQCQLDQRDDLTALVSPDGEETRIAPANQEALLDAVAEALPAELKATLEYPGYIAVPITEVLSATFGLANGYWGGELVKIAGGVADEIPVEPLVPATPVPRVVAAIVEAVQKLKVEFV